MNAETVLSNVLEIGENDLAPRERTMWAVTIESKCTYDLLQKVVNDMGQHGLAVERLRYQTNCPDGCTSIEILFSATVLHAQVLSSRWEIAFDVSRISLCPAQVFRRRREVVDSITHRGSI